MKFLTKLLYLTNNRTIKFDICIIIFLAILFYLICELMDVISTPEKQIIITYLNNIINNTNII